MVAERKREPLPNGCMTGKAKDITLAILDCALSQKAKKLLACITSDALGNAGLETEHPEEAGLWCDMDTARWAGEVGCSKPYVGRLTEQLIEVGLVTRHPPRKVSSENWKAIVSCRLRFNPDLAHWQPRQKEAHTERYSKPGAGRPRKTTTERDTSDKNSQPSVIHQISDSHTALIESGLSVMQGGAVGREDGPALTIRKIFDVTRPLDEKDSHVSRLPDGKIIPFITPASSESRAGEAAEAPVRKITEERDYEEESANADALALPDAAPSPAVSAPVSSSSPNTPQQAALFAGGTEKGKPAKPPARQKKAASKYGVTKEQQEALWVVWEGCAHTIKRADIGTGEASRHYGFISRLIASGVTPEELPRLIAIKADQDSWKPEGVCLYPEEIHRSLPKLRPIARGDVTIPARSNGYSQKGANHVARHTGQWTGNHGRDAGLVQRTD